MEFHTATPSITHLEGAAMRRTRPTTESRCSLATVRDTTTRSPHRLGLWFLACCCLFASEPLGLAQLDPKAKFDPEDVEKALCAAYAVRSTQHTIDRQTRPADFVTPILADYIAPTYAAQPFFDEQRARQNLTQ